MLHSILSVLATFVLRLEFWLLLAVLGPFLSQQLRQSYAGRVGARVSLSIVVALSFFPIGEWAIYPVEKRFSLPTDIEDHAGIIVLGGSENPVQSNMWNKPEFDSSSERAMAALALAKKHEHLKVIIAGGGAKTRGNDPFQSEAEVTAEFLLRSGIDQHRIILETQSKNTQQNAKFSKLIASPGDSDRWLLITSAFHMPRALQTFQQVGWLNLTPYPVDHVSRPFPDGIGLNLAEHLRVANLVIKEIFATLAYSALYGGNRSQTGVGEAPDNFSTEALMAKSICA